MNTRTISVTAAGGMMSDLLGNFAYLNIRQATNPVEFSVDGNFWRSAKLNDQIGPFSPQPTRIYFRALGGLDSTVTFDYSVVAFTSQSTSQKEASTYAKGTGEIAIGAAGLAFVGIDNGHQRKFITFNVKGGSNGLNVCDLDGNKMFGVNINDPPVILPADCGLILKPASALDDGVVHCQVGEVFYTGN